MSYSGEGNLIEAVILDDANKTVIPVVCDSQGRLIINIAAGTIQIGEVVITDGMGNDAKVDVEGDLQVDVNNFPTTSNATTSSTEVGDGPTEIVSANLDRRNLVLTNSDNSNPIYIALGSFVSPTQYTCKLKPGALFSIDNYSGNVSAVCLTRESTNVYITEGF